MSRFGWSYPPGCSGVPDDDERPVYVRCPECGCQYDEATVKFENIEEDIQGRDVLTFVCPRGHLAKSLRVLR